MRALFEDQDQDCLYVNHAGKKLLAGHYAYKRWFQRGKNQETDELGP